MSETTAEQSNSSRDTRADHLKPWQFKPGQSGNPSGKPKGTVSLKEYAKKYLHELSEEEKMEFMAGLDKEIIWKMAEGNPKQDTEVKGNLTISQVLDELENGQTAQRQDLEAKPPVQDQGQTGEADPIQAEQSAGALPPQQVDTQPDTQV